MTESVEILERIANEKKPPLTVNELERLRMEFSDKSIVDKTSQRARLSEMVEAFKGRGELSKWKPWVLSKIDACFEEHFMESGKVSNWLFVPNDNRNLNSHMKYCAGVD